MNDIIVYHGWYYWKRGSSCVYSFQYYRQHYFLSLGGGRKPHLPKMWEPSCRKNPSKTEQRTVVVLEFIKRELATFKTVIFFFFFHPSSQSKVDANVFENQKSSWACVQDVSSKTAEKKEETQQNSTCSIYVLICSKTSWPRNYISNEEKPLDIKKTSPQPRWVCWGNHQRAEREHTRAWKYIETLVRCVKDDATWNSFLRIFLEFILQRIMPSTGWNIPKEICWSLS